MKTPSEHLAHVVRTMPYNNVEPLFQREGNETLRFGGSCVQQQRVLAERLRKEGHVVKHLIADRTSHTVSITLDGSTIDLLDTSFRLTESAVLDQRYGEEKETVPAYPRGETERGVVRFHRKGAMIIEQLSIEKNGAEEPLKKEVFHLDAATDELPDLDTDIATIRNERSILILAVIGTHTVQLRSTPDGLMTIRQSGGPRMRPSSPEFSPLFARIAAINGETSEALHAYLKEGTALLKAELARV